MALINLLELAILRFRQKIFHIAVPLAIEAIEEKVA